MIDMTLQEIAGMLESKVARERIDAVEQFTTRCNIGLNNKIYLLDKDSGLQDDFHKGVREGLAEAKNLLEEMLKVCQNTPKA